MVTVECLQLRCRSSLNGRCKRTYIFVRNRKCIDFKQRKAQFSNVTTEVRCDVKDCEHNVKTLCNARRILISAVNCLFKDEGECEG